MKILPKESLVRYYFYSDIPQIGVTNDFMVWHITIISL